MEDAYFMLQNILINETKQSNEFKKIQLNTTNVSNVQNEIQKIAMLSKSLTNKQKQKQRQQSKDSYRDY
jgi:hypothetical protein